MRPLAGAKTMPSLFTAERPSAGAAHDPEERHAEHEQARDGARGDDFAHGVRGVKARHEGMPRLLLKLRAVDVRAHLEAAERDAVE